jgi:hypothetical protein
MGVLKVAFDLTDYVVTGMAMMILTDIAYQLVIAIAFDSFVHDMDTMTAIFKFRPSFEKYIMGWSIVEKILF